MFLTISDGVGYLGSVLLGLTLVPQVHRTYTLKSTRDLSIFYLILQALSNVCFLIYGYLIKSVPVLLCNGFVIIFTGSLLFAKWKFRSNGDDDDQDIYRRELLG
jgi:MtN3 and saliva related transmembrane protein